ncbi:MAG: murein L,D-transpeptidase [Acidobacteria bacterium]|nr:MAG: murein L,D-transpeptidase [Acidobacteriota bacterium]
MVRVQILLDRAGFSPGEIDGKQGKNLTKAIEAFQKAHQLPDNGKLTADTLKALGLDQFTEPLNSYTITDQDTAGPFTDEIPEDPMEQAKLPALNYTSVIEELGEKFHCNPNLLKLFNPQSQFSSGDVIEVPNLSTNPNPDDQTQATNQTPAANSSPRDLILVVSEDSADVILKDSNDDILFFAPATVGSEHDPLPKGDWRVTVITRNPVFHYNPDLFWDADPSNTKTKIAAGPNNPVGVVWIGVNAPHYGLHGTPEPGLIGHSQSHGCIRMTNWDALRLASLIQKGIHVIFQ